MRNEDYYHYSFTDEQLEQEEMYNKQLNNYGEITLQD